MDSLPPFQKLLEAHSAAVIGYLRASVGAIDADDCFQETVIAALRAYPDLKDGSNLRAWLFTIASNKAIDHHRAMQRRATPLATPEEHSKRGERHSHRHIGQSHGRSVIWDAVGALPPKQHEALVLRFAAEMSHREIGDAIGCSEAAARRNVHEGVKSLRKWLAEPGAPSIEEVLA